MNCSRWYDNDKHSKFIVSILEQADSEIQHDLAVDLVQIIIQGKYITQIDNFIERINNIGIPIRRRTYDRNETIFFAVEMLRHVDEDERCNLLKEFSDAVVTMTSEKKVYERNQECHFI